jgi:hypothetical protein
MLQGAHRTTDTAWLLFQDLFKAVKLIETKYNDGHQGLKEDKVENCCTEYRDSFLQNGKSSRSAVQHWAYNSQQVPRS